MIRRIIEVVPYNKNWPKYFESEKALIINSILVTGLEVHHIGSTSVIGLSAKPVIDILLAVENIDVLDTFENEFNGIGYECKGEYGISGRRYYQKGGNNRSHHIHAFSKGSSDIIRHLAFKEYLSHHLNIAREYENLKVDAALKCNNDSDIYCELKHEFIKEQEGLALDWYKTNHNDG